MFKTRILPALLLAAAGAWGGPGVTQSLAPTLAISIPAGMKGRDISIKVKPGLTRTIDLPGKPLQKARRDMLAGKDISPADLRALADHGDGLAAQKYFRILTATGPGASASDIAYYGTVAVATGRVWSLSGAVDAMRLLDPESEPVERKRAYIAMLYPHAWAGNPIALDAVMDLNGAGKLFGEMSDATLKRIVAQGAKNGDGRVALRLALPLLQKTDRTTAERAQVQDYLKQAMAGNNLAVRTTAANLLAQVQGDAGTPAVTQ